MYVGTDLVQTSLFDPYCYSCNPGGWGVNSGKTWIPTWQSEVFYPEADIPGIVTKTMNYTGLQAQRCCDDAWETNFVTPGNTNIEPNNSKPGAWTLGPFMGDPTFTVWRNLP